MERYRVRIGDGISGFITSSAVFGVAAKFAILYDNGQDDIAFLPELATVGNRTQETFSSTWTARLNGWVVGGVVASTVTLPKRGECYAVLWLVSGPGGGANTKEQLIGDYLYGNHTPTLGRIVDPGPGGGEGNMRSIDLGDPAVDVDYTTQTVPTNALWRIHGFGGTLVTTVGGSNRIPGLTADDGTNEDFWLAQAIQGQAASTTIEWIGSSIGAATDLAGQSPKPITGFPSPFLPETYRVLFRTVNLTAGDNWGSGQLLVEEWLVI